MSLDMIGRFDCGGGMDREGALPCRLERVKALSERHWVHLDARCIGRPCVMVVHVRVLFF